MNGEVVNTHIKATESTTLAKLSLLDQFKLLIHKFSNDDAAELNAAEKLSRTTLKMRAALQNLFTHAVEGFDEGIHTSVTLRVSSKFLPYYDDVVDKERGMGRFYNFEKLDRGLPASVEYMFIVIITRKVDNKYEEKAKA